MRRRGFAAGSLNMASSYRTGKIEEALLASQEVEDLAYDILSEEEYEKANEIAIMLVSSKPQKRKAVFELMKLVAPPPKRPLYYAQHELQFLPRWTRDAIRDLGGL